MTAQASQQIAKYAVFDCVDAEKWRGHEQVFFDCFGDRSGSPEKWDVFRCFKGELPDLETVDQYVAIFLSGSHCSANDGSPWIQKLADWLGAFARGQHTTKLVGLCFGCQILAKGLGGRVGKNPSGRFVLKVEELDFTRAMQETPFFQTLNPKTQTLSGSTEAPPRRLKVLESHGDQVLQLPPGAQLLSTSESAMHEIWMYGSNILAMQGHPEMLNETALEKICPAMTETGVISQEECTASQGSLRNTVTDARILQDLINAFING